MDLPLAVQECEIHGRVGDRIDGLNGGIKVDVSRSKIKVGGNCCISRGRLPQNLRRLWSEGCNLTTKCRPIGRVKKGWAASFLWRCLPPAFGHAVPWYIPHAPDINTVP